MKFYTEISLIPCTEIALGFLWEKVFQQVHLAFAENKTVNGTSEVGVSFPEYAAKPEKNHFPLGSKLRLFAQTEKQLLRFNIEKWLNRLTDYSHCTSIREVPERVELYAVFSRKQFHTNPLRLARRRAKRTEESLEQAIEYYSSFKDKETKLPFINMVSLSSEQKNRFRLFVERELVNTPSEGVFNCYGLSCNDSGKSATVPWF
ncbi:MAG: type I-F CRISPR-associated endoribonuclease Cas6/Csy4 [SAR324 cluster bacterium]|nr:type I-F CRISPR-associated endoribonuclease Cas6/Csy4 [SAR324 cluster bacterium]MBL7035519.1 type I-F CRISPR-associated endoribonuclease Cas6/Csy4 [SAR324 cluster bacterium]